MLSPYPNRFVLLGFVSIFMLACSPLRSNEALPAEEGDECSADADCGPGLLCGAENICSRVGAAGTGRRGDTCEVDSFCATGLVCGPSKVCGFYRPSEEDKRCTGSIPCAEGLVCNQKGRCAQPDSAGTTQAGDECGETADCGLGLFCSPGAQCETFPSWSGVECPAPITDGKPTILFDVPRGNVDQNFYTLPYPNDIRQYGGKPSLDGYPGANAIPGPGEFLGRYVSLLREQATGYGTNASVFFRFNTAVDYSTLKFGNSGANFAFLDVTEGSSRFGQPPRSRFYATESASPYVCENWLAIRPSEGTPLTPGHTYAVIFRRGLQDENGVPFEPSSDFSVLLNSVPPTHPALSHAWSQYAPLRNWMESESVPAEDLIAAAVFTVADPTAQAAKLREAVEDTPNPAVRDVVPCGTDLPSPCGTTPERQCSATRNGSSEIHVQLEVPSFLSGNAPYEVWGGQMAMNDDMQPRLQRLEKICMSVSVPPSTADAPESGWPTVILAHDFGDHFRTPELVKLTEKLTQLGWAVVRYDMVYHGSRYGESDEPTPEQLANGFYNMNRPELMRNLALQGVADLHSITRFLRNGKLETDAKVIEFDNTNLVFMGHGLGGEIGMPFLAYSPDIAAAVLLDSGGSMGDMLRQLENPVNLSRPLTAEIGDLNIQEAHPALDLMQWWLDPRDAQNYGSLMRRTPQGIGLKHIFYLYSTGLSATPVKMRNALVLSMSLPLIGVESESLTSVKGPKSGRGDIRANVGDRATHGMKQYEIDEDDRASILSNSAALIDVSQFLETRLTDEKGIPTIKDRP